MQAQFMQTRVKSGRTPSNRAIRDRLAGQNPGLSLKSAGIGEVLACLRTLALLSSLMLLCGWQIEQLRLSDAAVPVVADPVHPYP
jgi:hypothetical protein